MAADQSELLQGTLDLLILKTVAMGPIHGYAISKRIQQVSKDVLRVQQGSLYPALHRLEERKLLHAEWKEAESGREAKFYSLTAAGRKQLGAEEADWERMSEAIGLVLRSCQP
jgi:transcriptional regulator